MFNLKQSTQRILFRAIFILFCLGPTGIILAWGGFRHLPSSNQKMLQSLSEQVGLPARCQTLKRRRPGELQIHNYELLDPESGEVIAHAPRVEAIRKKKTWHLSIPHAEVEGDALLQVIASIHKAALCSRQAEKEFQFSIASLHLQQGEDRQTIHAFSCQKREAASGPTLLITFQLDATSTAPPIKLVVSRNRSASPPSTQIDLDSQGTPLPCSLITLLVPSLPSLGAEASYTGKLRITDDGIVRHQILQGILERVELDRIVSDHFPHQLEGSAQLVIHDLRLVDGRIESGDLSILSSGGIISLSLLDSAEQLFGSFSRGSSFQGDNANSQKKIRYDELALRFQIDRHGLSIAGLCDSREGPAFMIAESGTNIHLPERATPYSVGQVVQFLIPEDSALLPASSELDALLDRLPLPE